VYGRERDVAPSASEPVSAPPSKVHLQKLILPRLIISDPPPADLMQVISASTGARRARARPRPPPAPPSSACSFEPWEPAFPVKAAASVPGAGRDGVPDAAGRPAGACVRAPASGTGGRVPTVDLTCCPEIF
jgi:hypothetical protein